jgi:hypothetical protein
MLRYSFYLLLLLSAVSALALDERRARIIAVINEELAEVTRLSQQRNNRDPELLLRVAELHLEKARLTREDENEKFLDLPVEKRRTVNENQYYAGSIRSFQNANQYATAVTKSFPSYREIADVYYILAFNARELKNYKDSDKYFALARKKAPKGSKTEKKAKLALADSYFNKAKFSKAIPLYESALAGLNESWWTKDAFNLAWSYYRVKNYSKAISLMHEIHRRSGDSKYINMKYFVERDLVSFYVDAKRTNDAVEWYRAQGIDYSSHLIKIIKVQTAQGKFTQAEQLLAEAAKIQTSPDKRIEVLFLQLELSDKYNKIPSHLKAAIELTDSLLKGSLNSDQIKILDYQISKKAAETQKAAASPIYKDVKKTRLSRTRQAISYFGLLAKIKPQATAEPIFFQGETSYAAEQLSESMGYYLRAFEAAKNEKNNKIKAQAVEGMLATLGNQGLSPKQAEQFYVPVYTAYLKEEPNSARAKIIRQKLFKVYIDRKDFKNAEQVLSDYAQLHPEDFKSQEVMLASLMDDARNKKDFNRFKGFIVQINEGKYKVSKKYGEALRQMMTKIQIEDAQSALDKGDKAFALKSYIRIYENPESTVRAKANAAYNLAALYYEANDLTESYKWGAAALNEMNDAEVKQFSASFLAIGTNLFLRQRFQQSADLNTRTLAKLCKQGDASKNTAFKNASFLWLAEGLIEKTEEVLNIGTKCGIDIQTLNEVRIELAKEYQKLSRWESLEAILPSVVASKSQAPLAIIYLESLRRSYAGLGDSQRAMSLGSQILEIYRSAKAKNQDIPVEALDIIALGLMPKLEQKQSQLDSIVLSFPEDTFNNQVKRKLAILDSLTGDVNEIQKTGSGKGIVRAYKLLINSYEKFASELSRFTPEGKSEDYVASFKKAMSGVWTPILQTALKRRQEVKELIVSNNILSDDNNEMLSPQGTNLVAQFRLQQNLILMDRGGAQ